VERDRVAFVVGIRVSLFDELVTLVGLYVRPLTGGETSFNAKGLAFMLLSLAARAAAIALPFTVVPLVFGNGGTLP
jgi:hypothetical protein